MKTRSRAMAITAATIFSAWSKHESRCQVQCRSPHHLHFAQHCQNDLPSIVIQEPMCLAYYLHYRHSKWAHLCNFWEQQYHRNDHLESQHLYALLLQQFFWRRGMYTHDSCPVSVDFVTLACNASTPVSSIQTLKKQHSSGEKRHGIKDRQPSPEPVTYALTRSFSHVSYGIGHTPLSHIVAYVPVTGVLESTNCLRPVQAF